jgi:transcription initiation factor IIE alpha subunit
MNSEHEFDGFPWPTYTAIPNEFFDFQMVNLSFSETRVLLYMFRRTFGCGQHESISLDEMLYGRTASDGQTLDMGTGLKKKELLSAIRSLEGQGFIIVERYRSEDGGDEPSACRLNLQEP